MTTPPDAALLLAMRGAVRAEIQPLFAEMQRLFDRRIAELHASMELVDMNEAKLLHERPVVQEQIAGLGAPPSANSRNTGAEPTERPAAASLHLAEPAARPGPYR